MAEYPPDRFVQEFAKRTRDNLLAIGAGKPIVYGDTALIASLLAVFVLPHERVGDSKFMADLLRGYDKEPLAKIVEVLRLAPQKRVSLSAGSVPKSIEEIPKFLRNAVAHMNIQPRSEDGQSLTHLLVWNNDLRSRKTTFVASVHVAGLRSLALYLLHGLFKSKQSDKYDGFDPVEKFDTEHPGLKSSG